jgi:hypothetical protein
MNNYIANECKLCNATMNNACVHFPNKDGTLDICEDCGDYMKYLENDLIKDKIKFIRKIRCENCNFRICKINEKNCCLWCLNDDIIIGHKLLYGKYIGKTHAYVLHNDFTYCISQIQFRIQRKLDDSKLTHLTQKILNNVSHKNRYKPLSYEDNSINRRWM